MIIIRLTYRIRTGIHAGTLKMGFVAKTGYYIMPQVMIGAAINRMTRFFFQSPLPQDFYAVSAFIYDRIKFTPFYISKGGNIFRPDDTKSNRECKWGVDGKQLTADEFEHRFIRSYTGTAINYGVRAARDHTLHESEYIAARDRDGQALFLTGYAIIFPGDYAGGEKTDTRIFCLSDNGYEVSNGRKEGHIFKNVCAPMQIGGDRNYGMGLIENEKIEPVDDNKIFDAITFCRRQNGEAGSLQVNIEKNKPLGIPLKHNPEAEFAKHIRGTLTPSIQREFVRGKGAGKLISHRLYFEPGAYFISSQENLAVKIDDRGFWEF